MVIHCLFEQSGTFKNAFKKFGYQSYDYDILNDFNQTDFIVDLFKEIDYAFYNLSSIFDKITSGDLVIAFFPCVRFSNQAYMMFQCTQKQLRNLSDLDKLYKVIDYHRDLSNFYNILCKLCIVCLKRSIPLIIENPYSKEHYLTRYFPLKPAIIDLDRTKMGDNFKKPTQYWFINCLPKLNFVDEAYSIGGGKTISNTSDKVARSLINSNYAERFIKEFIL